MSVCTWLTVYLFFMEKNREMLTANIDNRLICLNDEFVSGESPTPVVETSDVNFKRVANHFPFHSRTTKFHWSHQFPLRLFLDFGISSHFLCFHRSVLMCVTVIERRAEACVNIPVNHPQLIRYLLAAIGLLFALLSRLVFAFVRKRRTFVLTCCKTRKVYDEQFNVS